MKTPNYVRKYFWETDNENLDLKESSEYIIGRILEYGDIDAVQWMFKNFSKNDIKNVFSKKKYFSLKSANFWLNFFNLNKKDILCLKKPYQKRRKTHWPY